MLKTEAEQEPVIAPGNMIRMVMTISRARGDLPKVTISFLVSAASRPFFSITFIKIIAVISTRDTSR